MARLLSSASLGFETTQAYRCQGADAVISSVSSPAISALRTAPLLERLSLCSVILNREAHDCPPARMAKPKVASAAEGAAPQGPEAGRIPGCALVQNTMCASARHALTGGRWWCCTTT